ncbi:hypothetical protein AGMMS49546_25970 [Spirochaetia bacterium]|nr:hypothetical protein AGMMS49546_25970 [Spirochaetia bacterium]
MKGFRDTYFGMFFVFLTVCSIQLFAQEKTLDGAKYTVVEPATYAFNADAGNLKVGQRYYMDGVATGVTGSRLMINDLGLMDILTLSTPMTIKYGTRVTLYVEVTAVTSYSSEAKVIKIEGAGIQQSNNNTAKNTITLDSVSYTVLAPATYAFNSDSGKLKTGDKYVLDGTATGVSGARLMINDLGLMDILTLSAPAKVNYGTKVRVYIEVTEVTSYSSNAKVVKLEIK